MKLKERISWLMGSVQRSLFPHLDECLETPLTDQEKHLVSILEIVQVEKHVPKSAYNQWLGRKLEEREALARAFAAKLLYRHPVIEAPINTEVDVEIGGGNVISAVITHGSSTRLGLKVGGHACVLFKASSVIIGVS